MCQRANDGQTVTDGSVAWVRACRPCGQTETEFGAELQMPVRCHGCGSDDVSLSPVGMPSFAASVTP